MKLNSPSSFLLLSQQARTSSMSAPSRTLCSHARLLVLMSWIVTITRKEAHTAVLARPSSWSRPSSATAFTTPQQLPRTKPLSSEMRRNRKASMWACHHSRDLDLGSTTYAHIRRFATLGGAAANCGGRERQLQRRWPKPTTVGVSLRSGVSGAHVVGGGDGAAGVNPGASSVGDGRRDGAGAGAGPGAVTTVKGRGYSAADAEPLVEQVATALAQRCGVRGGDLVLVLISGGSDSVALLLALHQAREAFHPPLRVEAAHFNHALRGPDSDADEEFVVSLAAGLSIPLHVRRWKGVGEGGTGGAGSGMQERARRWRRVEARGILGGMVEEAGFEAGGRGRGRGVVATAHHRDDQAETVLMKALRGAHVTKMQGMAWRSPPFVKPLLGARKSCLVAFLNERGQEWREDGSNQVAKYARNRVRLDLIPLLQELAGGNRALETRLYELSRQSLLAREMVEQEALRWERRQSIRRRDLDVEEEEDGSERAGQPEGTGPSAELEHDDGAEASSVAPPRVRREEFPLSAFLKGGAGSGGEGAGRRLGGADLPELVREELMHRFVTANNGGTPLPYAHLQLLMQQVDEGDRKWSLSLGGSLYLRRVGDFLRIERNAGGPETPALDLTTRSTVEIDLSQEGGGPSSSSSSSSCSSSSSPPAAAEGGTTSPWTLRVSDCQVGGASSSNSSSSSKGSSGSDSGNRSGVGDGGVAGDGSEYRADDERSSGGEDGTAGSDGGAAGQEQGMVLYNVASGGRLRVRRRRDGDRFRPAWRDRPTKLKDFLRGQGVPLHRRDEVALICDENDTIIAVYPYFPGFESRQDDTGTAPVRVRIEGMPLCCPRPRPARSP